MARSDTRKATSTRKKRDVAKTLKDLMKKPEYKTTRERKGPRGNTIIDYTVDGKPMTRRRVEGIGTKDSPRKMADKPLGPPKKPTGLDAVTKKQSPTDVMRASGRGKEVVAFPKTKPKTKPKASKEVVAFPKTKPKDSPRKMKDRFSSGMVKKKSMSARADKPLGPPKKPTGRVEGIGTKASKTRTIKAGDTLSQIAKDNNTTINALMKLNPQITNADRLYKGQKIKTTKGTEANPYKGYTFPKAKNPPKSKPQQTVQEKIEELNKKKVGKPGYNRRNSTSKKYGGKMVKKKEGGSVGSKSKSSKPKGVGCAKRGYGKAMGGK